MRILKLFSLACGLFAATAAFAQEGEVSVARLVTPAQEKTFRPAQSVARACGLSDVDYTALVRASAIHLADAEWVALCHAIAAESLRPRDLLLKRPDFSIFGQVASPASVARDFFGLAAPYTLLQNDGDSIEILREAAANAQRLRLANARDFIGTDFSSVRKLSNVHVQSVRSTLWSAGFQKPDEDLSNYPTLLFLELPTDFKTRIRFFRRAGCRDIAKLIATVPLMLRLSLDTLTSLDQRLDALGVERPFDAIAADPMILTYIKDGSLAGRLAGSCTKSFKP